MHRKRAKSSVRKNFVFFAATQLHRNDSDQFSPDVLERYWSIEKTADERAETFGLSDFDKEAVQILEKTVATTLRTYEIGLPWKTDVHIPNNFYAALNRVLTLEKRSTLNPELKKKFDETLTTALEKQYDKPVIMQNPPSGKIWYLPTCPVENPAKSVALQMLPRSTRMNP